MVQVVIFDKDNNFVVLCIQYLLQLFWRRCEKGKYIQQSTP